MAYIATFQGTAAVEHIDTIRTSMLILQQESQAQPGTLRYEFYQSQENPAVFLLFAIWDDQADWQAHVASDAHKQHVARLPAGAWAIPPVRTDWQAVT
jgi:quinol monooxygenase YgiN